MTGLIWTLAAEENPLNEVVNHKLWVVNDWWIWSSTQGNLVITAIIMLVVGFWVARHVDTGAPDEGHDRYITKNPFAHMIEVICIFLRDEVVHPLLHDRTNKFMPFLWTLFFFVLINNLLGLVPLFPILTLFANDMIMESHRAPFGGTATQNIWVTGALAVVSGLVINIAGLKQLGPVSYLKHMTGGVPMKLGYLPIVAIVFLIEVVGIAIKPIALAIRLFANMTAGHTLLATLGMFVTMAFAANTIFITGPVTVVTGISMIGVYCLEIFVAFVQAFVFMFLTAVFISLLTPHGEYEGDAVMG